MGARITVEEIQNMSEAELKKLLPDDKVKDLKLEVRDIYN